MTSKANATDVVPIHATVTPVQDPAIHDFPEIEAGIVDLSKRPVALCISGGGVSCHTSCISGVDF